MRFLFAALVFGMSINVNASYIDMSRKVINKSFPPGEIVEFTCNLEIYRFDGAPTFEIPKVVEKSFTGSVGMSTNFVKVPFQFYDENYSLTFVYNVKGSGWWGPVQRIEENTWFFVNNETDPNQAEIFAPQSFSAINNQDIPNQFTFRVFSARQLKDKDHALQILCETKKSQNKK